jgi:hypothetical protein
MHRQAQPRRQVKSFAEWPELRQKPCRDGHGHSVSRHKAGGKKNGQACYDFCLPGVLCIGCEIDVHGFFSSKISSGTKMEQKWQQSQSEKKRVAVVSLQPFVFITVDADIPNKTMPAVNNSFIAACWANPVNPIILRKMDIQPASA